MFVVSGDLSKVPVETCDDGEVSYLTKRFNVIFKFGTELQAQIQWEEDVSLCILCASSSLMRVLLMHREWRRGMRSYSLSLYV